MRIFVFGSNLLGRHGSGAALYARQHHGAKYGVGVGRTGNCWAIPTKRKGLRDPKDTLPLAEIQPHVANFIADAKASPEDIFDLTRVGCGLAGYKDHQMAPLFKGIPSNVIPPKEWEEFL